MTVKEPTPIPSGGRRKAMSRERRDAATRIAHDRPHPFCDTDNATTDCPRTVTNGEEALYQDTYCTGFTKGLAHDANGLLRHTRHYESFVEGLNREDDAQGPGGGSWFEANVPAADPTGKAPTHPETTVSYSCTIRGRSGPVRWRGWESPRAGHAYDLEGPDAESLCMAPAPTLASAELHVEMAELYALALLRDVPFSRIADGSGMIAGGGLSAGRVGELIGSMPWFGGEAPGDERERARRSARGIDPASPRSLFRGSAPGAKDGPYLSQFLVAGNEAKSGADEGGAGDFAGMRTDFRREDGLIAYGTQVIDQRNVVHAPDVDYMSEWGAWLDVQNGANVTGSDRFLSRRRFMTTPRDLATFVHFDQLYQAYFNAALQLGALELDTQSGFPSGARTGYPHCGTIKRDSFATFGGPHLLGLLTEVSTRALRAVRRQKFNYHRRARPEAMGWIAAVAAGDASLLGKAEKDACGLLAALPDELLDAIAARNDHLNQPTARSRRRVECAGAHQPDWLTKNYLLPMAFPEGSPMHPAYGAGHATVAGACVTILKAFYMLRATSEQGWIPVPYGPEVYEPDATADSGDQQSDNVRSWGRRLRRLSTEEVLDEKGDAVQLTVEGELNKLAANISIGRNMAGVHYYTDYYDSLRLGERIAVGILEEQMTNYPDKVDIVLWDFDGRRVEIAGDGHVGKISAFGAGDVPVDIERWWSCGDRAGVEFA